jgi:hypothetical protein
MSLLPESTSFYQVTPFPVRWWRPPTLSTNHLQGTLFGLCKFGSDQAGGRHYQNTRSVNRHVWLRASYPAINSGCSTIVSSLRSSFAKDPALK